VSTDAVPTIRLQVEHDVTAHILTIAILDYRRSLEKPRSPRSRARMLELAKDLLRYHGTEWQWEEEFFDYLQEELWDLYHKEDENHYDETYERLYNATMNAVRRQFPELT
jgi:hypothetical protein